eukprot:2118627-Pyramimonas_sp.AAC.1
MYISNKCIKCGGSSYYFCLQSTYSTNTLRHLIKESGAEAGSPEGRASRLYLHTPAQPVYLLTLDSPLAGREATYPS